MKSEQLKPQEFEAHIEKGTLRLALVGMSNAGKSHRSRVLQKESGFELHHVDARIATLLGLKSTEDLSRWMGFPSAPDYQEKEEKYLALEDECTKSAAIQTEGKNLVFDTTGSVIYLTKKTLAVVKKNCLVVHIDVGEDSIEELMERFFKERKPVVWSDFFNIRPGEQEKDALRRCYPALLHDRLQRYRALSHVNIPVTKLHDASGEEILLTIKEHLR